MGDHPNARHPYPVMCSKSSSVRLKYDLFAQIPRPKVIQFNDKDALIQLRRL